MKDNVVHAALNSAKAASNLSSARLELSKGVKAIPNFLLDYAEIIDAATFEVAEDSCSLSGSRDSRNLQRI